MNINGEYGLIGDSLTSLDSTAKIELSNNEINLEATNVLVNGQAIGVAQGFVTNPLSSNLNCNNKNLFNVGTVDGFDLAIQSQDIENLESKTFHIQLPLSGLGTIFSENVYAEKFITSATQPPRYLMSDGTELSNSGNNAGSNIYLYNNNNTLTPIPANGQIRFNQAPQPSATQLYISHRTRDGIDIEDPFLSSISALSIIYIQDQDVSENYIRFNVNSAPVIVVGSYVTLNVSYLDSNGTGDTNFGAGMNIILSIFSNDIEIDTRLSNLETKTQNQTGFAGDTTFTGDTSVVLRVAEGDYFSVRNDTSPYSVGKLTVSNTSVQINSVPLFMQGQRIRDVGSPTEISDVAVVNTLTAGSVPYFTATNRLSGASKNQFVELGNSTIQSAIDAVTLGGATGGAVQVSSGGSTENVICPRQNYTLVGTICPPFTQTTQITGNLTIGSAAFLSTRVRVSHMKFLGNLIFDNSTNQQLRTYFYNCDWNGTVTFPTSAATGTNGTQIFFDSCTFSGASAIVIPNQNLYTIFFTRCAFIGQTITNQQPIGNITKTIFSDCSYLPTLSTLGNCILNGPNTTLTTTQANYGSIVLGGTAASLLRGNGTALSGMANQVVLGNGTLTTSNANSIMKGDATTLAGTALQYVMGDATLLTATYPTMTTGSFTLQWTGGAGGTTSDQTIDWRRISDGTSTTVWLRLRAFTVTIGTANSQFGVLCTVATVPANLSVLLQPNLPIITTFNGIIQCGWLVHYGTTLGIQPANKSPALATTVCGIPNVTMVSYMI